MRKIILLLIITLCLSAMVGCGSKADSPDLAVESPESTESAQEDAEPEPEEEGTTLDIDFDAVAADVKEQLTDPDYFEYVKDILVQVDEDKKLITFVASVDDSTDPAVALDFADTLVRRFNATACSYDSNLSSSAGADYYGALYDLYDFNIGIAPASDTADLDGFFVFEYINKGTHKDMKLNS